MKSVILFLALSSPQPYIATQRPSFNRCVDKSCRGVVMKVVNPRKKAVETTIRCGDFLDTEVVPPRTPVVLDLGWDRGDLKNCRIESWIALTPKSKVLKKAKRP